MTLYPYQSFGAGWLSSRSAAILADEPGLGKSAQAIGAVGRSSAWPCLVICPAGLKLNWQAEFNRWTPPARTAVVTAGSPWPRGDVVICNYDILHRYPEARRQNWGSLILDEAHYAKSADSRRAQAAFMIPCQRRYLLTGTPILNDPRELYLMLAACDPQEWGDWPSYSARYCPEFQIVAHGRRITKYSARNLDELAARAAPWILRRRKAEVLPELPPKRESTLTLEVPPVAPPGGRRGMALVRHEEGLARVPASVEHIARLIGQGAAPLVVWCWHTDVARALAEPFGAHAAMIDGSVPLDRRDAAVRLFQAGSLALWVGQIVACGTGITLTRADRCLFVERSWVPAQNDQAADRLHRIGQRASVLVESVYVADSFDAVVQRVERRKRQTANAILGESLEAELSTYVNASPENIFTPYLQAQ